MQTDTNEIPIENLMPRCIPASSLRSGQFITFSSAAMDDLMQGGIRTDTITEFVGESGSGKTQLCLQLSLTVQLPPSGGGLYGVAVYFCCDYFFPVRRLDTMKESINARCLSLDEKVSLENVLIRKVENCNELKQQIGELEKLCLQRSDTSRHVRLAIIDSFAALFRSEFENNKASMTQRAKYFTWFSTKLREVSHKYNLAVVVTNQVADDFTGTTYTTNNNTLISGDSQTIVPALGMAWANCVHNRLFLQKSPATSLSPTKRKMKIIYSPYMPPGECEFTITSSGIV